MVRACCSGVLGGSGGALLQRMRGAKQARRRRQAGSWQPRQYFFSSPMNLLMRRASSLRNSSMFSGTASSSSAGCGAACSFVLVVCRAFVCFNCRSPGVWEPSPRRNGAEFSLPLMCPPQSARGWSAGRRNHLSPLPFGRRAFGGASPSGTPPRLFCPRGRNFRARTGGQRPPRSGRLSPAFVRAAFSPCGRPLLVGADGGPRPPGSGVTSPARRRRTHPALCSVLQDAPRVGRVMGIYD